MAFTKPNVNTIWADTGSSISPATAKIAQGWIAEIPDFEFENWIQNRQDQFNAHVNQFGIVVWDSLTTYEANKSYVQASNGVVYRALTSNTNKNPTVSSSDWVQAFDAVGTSYSKSQSDSFYAKRANNLSDISSAPSARNNLSVYSKAETDAKYEVAVNLIGMVSPFGGTTAPTGWLKCDGSVVSRTTYSALFNQIGTIYGNGNGSTTFQLPDLRGEFVRGWDDGRGVDSGRAIGSSQTDSFKSHNHVATSSSEGYHSHTTNEAPDHTHGIPITRDDGGGSTYIGGTRTSGGATTKTSNAAGRHSHTTTGAGTHTHTISVGSTGGSETRPRNVAMLYCIKH